MKRNKDLRLILQLLIIFAISRATIMGVYYVYSAVMKDNSGFEVIFGRWDAIYYTDLVEGGYDLPLTPDAQINVAFFPLYPMVCKGLYTLLSGIIPAFYICLIISNTCIFFAAFFAVKLVRLMGLTKAEANNPLFRGLTAEGLSMAWLLFMGPFTVYFATAYTESMYVLWIVISLYLMKKGNFLAAGGIAALASVTRSLGCLLIIPLFMEMYKAYKKKRPTNISFIKSIFIEPEKLLSLIIVPAGIFAFMIYLHYFTGDAWAFKHVQVAWRTDEYMPIVGVLASSLAGYMGLSYQLMGFIALTAIAVYIYMWIQGHSTEAIWGLASIMVPLASHVMSISRFISGSFVIWIGFYIIMTKLNNKLSVIFTCLWAALGVFTVAIWMAWLKFMM